VRQPGGVEQRAVQVDGAKLVLYTLGHDDARRRLLRQLTTHVAG
jgi:hypothetical protein